MHRELPSGGIVRHEAVLSAAASLNKGGEAEDSPTELSGIHRNGA
jgi:hypothetical protein